VIGHDAFDQRGDLPLVARVAVGVGALEVDADDGRAFGAKQLDRGLANARTAAGDDRDLAVESLSPMRIVLPPSTTSAWPLT
jgi:hypothetical protein